MYAVQLGFTESHDVQGRLSIADLFLKSRKRCGIYLLEFDDGLYYIGQAVDVVRRFAQHRKNYANIARLSFQATHRRDLDAQEQQLIHQAEAIGTPLINKIHTSYVAGETDLDLLISLDEQEAWLADPATFAHDTMRIHAYVDEPSRIKYKYSFQKFQADPRFQRIIELLQQYIVECVPAYRRTEFSFWSVSCLPSTNHSTYPRLICINMNAMECFVIGYQKRNPDQIWAFINVAETPIAETYNTEERFYQAHPNTRIALANYRAGGADQLAIEVTSLEQISALLNDPTIRTAARELNLRLMRKGGNLYARSHCYALADHLIT